MNKTTGSLTVSENGISDERFMFTYSEQEKQQNEINEANAKLVFSPAFITDFVDIEKRYGLTPLETRIYGFIWFYLTSGNQRFYFTNEQLADITNCSADTASRAISTLKNKNIIELSMKIKAGGGQIRFINRLLVFPEYGSAKTTTPARQKLQGNENKIKENKINTYTKLLTTEEKEALELINYFNSLFDTKYTEKYLKHIIGNFIYWKDIYSLEDMKKALDQSKKGGFVFTLDQKLDLVLFLRTKSKSGPCDYIGQLLSRKSIPDFREITF
jgi:hypothetical protein